MVRMVAPSACAAGTRQLLTRAPFISIAQVPHSPSPQPSFVPVSPGCSRRTSSNLAIGYACRVTVCPLIAHCTWILWAASDMHTLQNVRQLFRGDGNFADVHTGCVGDGIGDRRGGSIQWEFADTFCARRTRAVGNFLEEDADGRNVHGGRHDVVGHLAIHHAAFVPDYIFREGKTDSLS